jgi:hypothetical protein
LLANPASKMSKGTTMPPPPTPNSALKTPAAMPIPTYVRKDRVGTLVS